MKVLIILGFIVVFISAFFILFTMNTLGEKFLDCKDNGGNKVCTMKELDGSFGMGLSFICFFLVLSLFTMYIIFTNLKEAVED